MVTPLAETMQSRTSSRRKMAGKETREGMSVGMSLTLCTATSMVSSKRASSSSLMKIPLPPICVSCAWGSLSPEVLMMTISASTPAAENRRLRTYSACHFASTLPRVPMRRCLTASPGEKGRDRAGLRRFESCGALLANARAQRFDQADELDAGLPGEELAHVFVHDDFGTRDLAFARVAILLHNFGEVVDVIDVKIVEIGGSRLDVARNAQIHEEEGAIGTSGHGLFENLARQDGFFRGDRGHHDVGSEER